MAVRSGYDVVVRSAQAANLPAWVHPHTLRHSYATKLIRATGDVFLVSRVLGHSNMQTTARYYLSYDATYADKAAEVFN